MTTRRSHVSLLDRRVNDASRVRRNWIINRWQSLARLHLRLRWTPVGARWYGAAWSLAVLFIAWCAFKECLAYQIMGLQIVIMLLALLVVSFPGAMAITLWLQPGFRLQSTTGTLSKASRYHYISVVLPRNANEPALIVLTSLAAFLVAFGVDGRTPKQRGRLPLREVATAIMILKKHGFRIRLTSPLMNDEHIAQALAHEGFVRCDKGAESLAWRISNIPTWPVLTFMAGITNGYVAFGYQRWEYDPCLSAV